VKTALAEAGVRDSRTVLPLLDLEGVRVKDDGTVTGLSEQVATLKDKSSFLFADADTGTEDTKLVGQKSGEGKSSGGRNPFKPGDGFSLTEQARIYREDRKLAETLQAQAEAESGE
jgi:hypothetical protein